jgi:hypothetical protein
VAHAYNPSYLRGRDLEDGSWKLAQARWFKRLYLEKTHHKKELAGWLKQ